MRGLLLMLIPAVLMAQRPALPTGEAFDRELKGNRLGTWLVLEDEGAAWGAMALTALDEDILMTLNLPLRVVAGGKQADALAASLRERFSWIKGAHWALVDAKGRILVEGSSPPTTSGFTAAAEQAGVRSRAQELEAFLRQNPDHLEAQMALLLERVTVANRRTRKIFGNPPSSPSTSQPDSPEPTRMLDPESDLKIWSAVVQQLDRLFQGAWREAGYQAGLAISISAAERSPSMIAVLTRHRGDIEEALRQRPNAVDPWLVWLGASKKCGWPLSPLLQSLQPLPGTMPGEWPPMMALTTFIKDAKARRDWIAIREVLEARWEHLKTSTDSLNGEGWWDLLLSPLLESLISLWEVGAADLLMNEAVATEGSSELPGKARDLATRLKRPDLATRWGALLPKGR
jgi:hypothetical protein